MTDVTRACIGKVTIMWGKWMTGVTLAAMKWTSCELTGWLVWPGLAAVKWISCEVSGRYCDRACSNEVTIPLGNWMTACEDSGEGRPVLQLHIFYSSQLVRWHQTSMAVHLRFAEKLGCLGQILAFYQHLLKCSVIFRISLCWTALSLTRRLHQLLKVFGRERVIIIMEMCNAPTPQLKALNKHNTTQ